MLETDQVLLDVSHDFFSLTQNQSGMHAIVLAAMASRTQEFVFEYNDLMPDVITDIKLSGFLMRSKDLEKYLADLAAFFANGRTFRRS